MSVALKQKLLKLGVFDDNEYLAKYVELIAANVTTKRQKFITQQHHIVPKVYFKYVKQPTDNTKENLVHLQYCDHVLAHCLLALSFKNTYLISASIDGIYAVLNSFGLYSTLQEFIVDYPLIKDILKCQHIVTQQQKLKLSLISSNSKWYNNGQRESFSRTCPPGWQPGRLPFSQQQREHARARFGSCRWYNNGIKSTFSSVCPDGWRHGRIVTPKLLASQKRNSLISAQRTRIPGLHTPKTNFRWYNNGCVQHRFQVNPGSGWLPGRLPSTKAKIKNTKVNKNGKKY